jgi:hypothetical protein
MKQLQVYDIGRLDDALWRNNKKELYDQQQA